MDYLGLVLRNMSVYVCSYWLVLLQAFDRYLFTCFEFMNYILLLYSNKPNTTISHLSSS